MSVSLQSAELYEATEEQLGSSGGEQLGSTRGAAEESSRETTRKQLGLRGVAKEQLGSSLG